MNQYRLGRSVLTALGVVVTAVVIGLSVGDGDALAQQDRPPADAPKPARVHNAMSAIQQTAAIVEATLDRKVSEYTAETGPWTRYEFSKLVVHRGALDLDDLVFVQRGGFSPDGKKTILSTVHDLVEGQRYVLFLRNTSWSLSPIVGEHAYRVVEEAGQALLVGPRGRVVENFDAGGARFSAQVFARPDLIAKVAPVRLAESSLPLVAASVEDLLQSVDAQGSMRGLNIAGKFYNEPRTRAAETPVARHTASRDLIHLDEATKAPGLPDSVPPLVDIHQDSSEGEE